MKKFIMIAALCSFLLFMLAGYYVTLWMGEREKLRESVDVNVIVQPKQRIGADTKIIYRYKYPKENITKEKMELAPSYLQGLDAEQLKSVYHDWEVIRFSAEKVILQCSMDGKTAEEYLLGISEDKVAVFYHDPEKGVSLKEKTDIPLSALPQEEVNRLKEGIRVNGEEELAKQLSDFSS